MSKIKICGVTTLDDIECVNKSRCDYVGFVFAESKRKVSIDLALMLKKNLNKNMLSVGVFVDEDIDFIKRLCDSQIVDLIQLHGNENSCYISQIKLITNKPVIKAFRIRDINDVKLSIESNADFLLFDTYDKLSIGGTGKTFDWDLIKGVNRDYFLAGGLNYDNIPMAYLRLKPFAFDVSSGVESNGAKDCKKISEIVSLVRSLN